MGPPLPTGLRAEYEAGATMQDLAEKYHVSRRQISNWLQRAGTQARTSGPRRQYDGGDPAERHRKAAAAYRTRIRGEAPRPRGGLHDNPDFDVRVADLHEAGAKPDAIAEQLGVSARTVRRSLARSSSRTTDHREN